MLDPVIASRLQFAFTTIVHIIFPVMSMGLASFLIYFTQRDICTDDPVYEQLRRFWAKIFAVSLVVGTVVDIAFEFESGTNSAAFSTAAGELFGGLLATEGMMAFMLEAMFFGVFVFGREKASDVLYVASTVAVGLGTRLSVMWILVANPWTQTPRGYEPVRKSGQLVISLVDSIAAYTNPRFLRMFVHMQNAAVLSVALFMADVAAYHIWQCGTSADDDREDAHFWRETLRIALVVLPATASLQTIHGDTYGRHVYETQPQKFIVIEAVWETDSYVPEYILTTSTNLDGITDPCAKELFGIGIPGRVSWLASDGNPQVEITGLNELDTEAPPAAIVFWSLRLMVAAGFWFILLVFWAGYRWWVDELYEDDLLHKAFVGSSLLGIFAAEVGWIVTEAGRQPWVIQSVLRTSEGVLSGLTSLEAMLTLVGFAAVYTGLPVLYTYVIRRIIRGGPPSVDGIGAGAETAVPAGVIGDD